MKNLIIWIEDRPDTVSDQIQFCRKLGFEVKVVATAHRFAEKVKQEKERTCLIIVDIMLFGIMSLESIGIPNSATESGYAAGWVLINRYLRPDPSVDKEASGYYDIPILIVSSRKLYDIDSDRLNNIKARKGAWLDYIEKGEIDPQGNITWTEKFEKVITDVAKKELSDGDKSE
jgi:hypothetical protein